MASRGDIEAGKAHVLVYLKNQLAGGINAMGKQLQGLGTTVARAGAGITALGGAIVAPLAGAVSHFLDVGGALDDMSARTGIARSTLGELAFAASQSGASLEDVEKSTARMQRTIVEASQGNQTAVDSLKLLGLTAADLQGKLPDEQLEIVTDALAGVQDPAVRTAAAFEILGRSGTKLLPMAGQLRALREEAVRLGLAPTEESVKLADALGDTFGTVKDVIGAAMFEIGAAIAPALLPAAEAVKEIVGAVNRWIRENGSLVRTIALIGAGLVGAGVAVTVIGGGIFALGTAFTAIAGAITGTVGILGASLGALLSPVGILVATLGTLAFLWFKFSNSGKAAVSQVMNALAPLIDTVRTTFQGIFDALAGGDFALAGQIAMTGLRLAFAQGLELLLTLFEGTLGDFLGTVGTQLIEGNFVGAWETATLGIAAVWDSLVAGVLETMAAMVNKIKELWNSAIATIRGSIIGLRAVAGFLPAGSRLRTLAEGGLSVLDSGVGAVGTAGRIGLGVGSAATGIASAAARDQERKSRDAFSGRIAGGADRARSAAEDLGGELAALAATAATARARAGERFAAVAGSEEGEAAAAAKTSIASTFSGAAFLALAQGGKTGIERIASEQLKEQKKLTGLIDEQLRASKDLAKGLTAA